MKRTLSMILALLLCVSLFPAAAFADGEEAEAAPTEESAEVLAEPAPEEAPAVPAEPEEPAGAAEPEEPAAEAEEPVENEPSAPAEDVPAAEEDVPALDSASGTVTTAEYSGSCGDSMTWTISDAGVLTISGTGAMDYFDYEEEPWYTNNASVITIVVEEGVEEIPGCAFWQMNQVTDLYLPASLISFDASNSLLGCSALRAIHVDEGSTSYCGRDGVLFNKSMNLLVYYPNAREGSSYTVPEGVTMIGGGSFANVTTLSELRLADTVEIISGGAFICFHAETLRLPAGLQNIGNYAFQGASVMDIYYGGTADDWNAITVGGGNDGLSSAVIHAGDGSVIDGGDYGGDPVPDPGEEELTFSTFEELTELLSQSYEDYTFVHYTGSGDFVFEDDVEIPETLSVDIAGTTVVIPEGVTVTVYGDLYAYGWTVSGKLIVHGYAEFQEDMAGDGELAIDGGSVGVSLYAGSEQELRAQLAREPAMDNMSYYVNLSADILLTQDLTLDRFMDLGGFELTVAEGAALRVSETAIVYDYGGAVVIRGDLVNDGMMIAYGDGALKLAAGGSYSGTGSIRVSVRDVDGEDAVLAYAWKCLEGFDHDEFITTLDMWDENFCQVTFRYGAGLTQLAAPTELTWNKEVSWTWEDGADEPTYEWYDVFGSLLWKNNAPSQGEMAIAVYRVNGTETTKAYSGNWVWGDGDQPYMSMNWMDWVDEVESGDYYFTVRSVGSGKYYDSETATSGIWHYDRPAARLGVCTDVVFNGSTITFRAPQDEGPLSFQCRIWYAEREGEEPRDISMGGLGVEGSPDELTSDISEWVADRFEDHGAGWYSVSVRATSDDVTETFHGAWSERSEAVYLAEAPQVRTYIYDADVELSEYSYEYDGTAKRPAVTVTLYGEPLTEGIDYVCTYENDIGPGWAYVIVEGIGDYRGRMELSYEIREPEILTGWQTIDGNTYYFDEDGAMVTGLQEIDGEFYYFGTNGVQLTGRLPVDDDNTYNYFDPENGGRRVTNQFVTVGESQYYFGADGAMYMGLQKIGKYYYFFNPTTGVMAVSAWKTIADEAGAKHKYYFRSNGRMATGKFKVSGKYYYFYETEENYGVMAVSDWIPLGEDLYYFRSNGQMATGWFTVSNKQYYFGDDGVARKGMQVVNGNTYYFDDDTGRMLTSAWKTVKDGEKTYKYYFRSNGRMATGMFKISNKWYYFRDDGTMAVSEWYTDTETGNKYYYRYNGRMALGLLPIGKSTYYFYETGENQGVMAKDVTITIDGTDYTFGSDGRLVN